MNSDESGLVAAVTSAPWDDLPRLVYADWLEERAGPGDVERAECIRLQCERWRTRERRTYPQPMKARITELRTAYEGMWRASLPQLEGVEWGRFWRGFVSEAKFSSSAALLDNVETVFAACPVQFVQMRGLGPTDTEAVCRLPQMTNLYGLRLDDVSLDLSMWNTLTTSDWFSQLRHLIAHPTPDETPSEHWIHEDLLRNDEIVRLVLSASERGNGRLYKVFFAIPTWADHQNDVKGRVMLDGFKNLDFEPL